MASMKKIRKQHKESELSEAWCVVCTDLHSCIGPYDTPEDATVAARRLTDDKGNTEKCVYLPVPLTFRGVIMHQDEADKLFKGTPPTDPNRGYL